MSVKAVLALGSNMGDTRDYINQAISALDRVAGINVVAKSGDYRTPPWGPVAQDPYRNCCILVEATCSAHDLLRHSLSIESALGRVRDVRWGPRTIDIDLVLFGDEKISDDVLQLPHPRMGERSFVLVPLKELLPTYRLEDGRSVDEAIAMCGGVGEIIWLNDNPAFCVGSAVAVSA
ncbi:2-amino-4-hydroxy-6-hydroxymethyldihydropteridine diphosphokinase [Polycladidibacter hongkongensis]|uniref:2-amino-4-hydroxy-6- hydroxymethyldihydropteridine diphosphokinase n=1 Tax=Polycladidibacter hongkongensis TaxID=1647556 RepID=UPI000836AA2C|nr:2-amino-4-hydroxy-6-hydroxymethyldihydropteridine diphosphokinase [Pseudovibrio hongkongensis]